MNINFKGGYFNFSFFNQIRLDKVQWVHGQCPVSLSGLCLWTLSSLPCPWTMSRLSTKSMDNVHYIHGQYPLNPWTLSSLAGLTRLCPWNLFRVSMDIVQTIHWAHGKCPLSPWTISRESTDSMDFLQTGLVWDWAPFQSPIFVLFPFHDRCY